MRTQVEKVEWESVVEIPDFPFKSFAKLQKAITERHATIGVDPLAASEWADRFLGGWEKVFISALSLLLIVAAVAAAVAALLTRNYWLLVAIPVQGLAFYLSHPASHASKWMTIVGVASIFIFADLLLNRMPTLALLVAYAGLTFAAVRAVGYLTSSAFRRALASDESLFLSAYTSRACTVRDNKAKRIYQYSAQLTGTRRH